MQCPQVLVVDEDLSFCEAVETTIKDKYKITKISNYAEALEFAQKEEVAVVILGIENDAISTLQKLQQICVKTPIIIASEEYTPDFLLKMLSAHAFAFVPKPLESPKDLKEYVKIAVEWETSSQMMEIVSASSTRSTMPQVVSATSSWIELDMPAWIGHITPFYSFLRIFMEQIPSRECKLILYALRELIQNGIEHGSKNSSERKIKITYLKSPRFVLFTIYDQGPGFNMNDLPHAAVGTRENEKMKVARYREEQGIRPGGFGICSVLGIVDELIYNQKGNAVTMIKHLPFSKTSGE